MVKPSRSSARVVKPLTLDGPSINSGWHGVPGARHIPATSDPAFHHFASIATEWKAANIEMTDEVMAAALKLAQARAERARREAAALAEQRAREAAQLAAIKPPESYSDASNGVVYYIRRGNYVKIGTTTNLRTRMRDLMPDEVLAVEPGSYSLEAVLHARFAPVRFAAWCEYFELTPELQAHINEVITQHGPPPPGLSQFNPAA